MVADPGVSLRHAANQYCTSLPSQQRGEEQQEIDRFIRWCGRDRAVRELTPLEIEQYGAWVAMESADPSTRLISVRSFLGYLKKKNMVPVALVTHLRVPKGKRARQVVGAGTAVVQLSAEGRATLEARLEILREERVNVVADIQRAMADKDFRENAPLDAAKDRQGQIESTIRELEDTLARAVLRADQDPSATVRLGHTVRLQELSSGKITQYTLVDPAEADPGSGKISSISPVGRALLQKSVGEEVSISVPRGTITYKIEKVES